MRITSSTSAEAMTNEERELDTNGTQPTGKTSGPTYAGALDFADRALGTTSKVGWLELLRWRVVHLFGIHTPIEAVNVELDEFNTLKKIERRRECAVCEVVM